MTPRLRVILAVGLLAAVSVLGLHVGGLDTGLLYLAPALALALLLLGGHYPGEDVIARSRWRRRPRRGARIVLQVRAPARMLPRGGLLVGHALAGRAPPA